MFQFAKLQNKMSALIGTLLLCLVTYFAISTHTNRQNTHVLENTKDSTYPVLQAIDSNIFVIERLRESLNAAAGTREVEEIDHADEHSSRVLANFEQIEIRDPRLSARVMELRALYTTFYEEARGVSLAVARGDTELSAAANSIKSFNAKGNKFEDELKIFRTQQYNAFTSQISRAAQGSLQAESIGYVLMIVSFIVFVIIIIIVRKQVIGPIITLAKNSQKVALGEFPPAINVGSHDEIAVLCRNFSAMTKDIQKTQDHFRKMGEHSRIISSARSLSTIRDLVQNSFTDLSESDLVTQVYFTRSCFVGHDLSNGYFLADAHGVPVLSNLPNIEKMKEVYHLLINVNDPITDEQLAIIGVMGHNLEKKAESLRAVATNVANALSAVRLNYAMKLIEQHAAESKTILEAVAQGICLIDGNMTLSTQYSRHLETLVKQTNLGGKSLKDLLISQTTLSEDAQGQLEAAIDNIVGQDLLNYEVNRDILPRELTIEGIADDKLLEIDWVPIVDGEDNVSRLVTTIRDVTEMRQYRAEEQRRKDELKMVEEILSVRQSELQIGLQGLAELIHKVGNGITSLTQLNSKEQRDLARNTHTLKGNARSIGLSFIAEAAHTFESDLFKVLEGREDSVSVLPMLEFSITNISLKLNQYQELFETRILAQNKEKTQLAQQVSATIEQWQKEHPGVAIDLVHRLNSIISPVAVVHLTDVIKNTHDGLTELSRIDGKIKPLLNITGEKNIKLSPEAAGKLLSIFNHLMRNAYDHGVKNLEHPEITVTCHNIGEKKLEILVGDNGFGLNMRKLTEIGLKLGLLTKDPSDKEIANLIFADTLSTSVQITSVSGRGIGLNAVREMIVEMGGSIGIEFTSTEREGDFRKFKFSIELPTTVLQKSGTIIKSSAA